MSINHKRSKEIRKLNKGVSIKFLKLEYMKIERGKQEWTTEK